jgi:hypothetical protein
MGLDKSACANQSQKLLDDEQPFPNLIREGLPTNRPVTADSGIVSVMAIFRQLRRIARCFS